MGARSGPTGIEFRVADIRTAAVASKHHHQHVVFGDALTQRGNRRPFSRAVAFCAGKFLFRQQQHVVFGMGERSLQQLRTRCATDRISRRAADHLTRP